MFLYRIEKAKYKDIFPPRGSLYVEGRWNRKGMWVVYTSETASLAKLEALANSGSKLPDHRLLLTIELQDHAPVVEITGENLPEDWSSVPYKKNLALYLQQIIESGRHVAVLVPSIHSHHEKNVLLLPDHPQFKDLVRLVNSTPIKFDQRFK